MTMKPLYAVSTSVGSGKTVAAVQYMARPESCTQDFIYVAPTIRLLNQTEHLLRSTLANQAYIRSVHLIHSEACLDDGYGAAREALLTINEQPSGLGRVVFLTTATFIRILSALFEHTVLHHLWSRCFGVRFITHPWFSQERLRDVHKEQGPWVAVGHLLHQSDRASKHNLFSNRHTGEPGETTPGERVLDHLVNLGAQFLKGSGFLLQTNNGTGYGAGAALLPDGAHPITVISHGLNDFKDMDNILALAVTNPNPQEADWVQTRTGLTKDQVLQAYRIHTVYQAVGRTSIRAGQQTSRKKVFLVAGYEDARLLHRLFQGSTWLG